VITLTPAKLQNPGIDYAAEEAWVRLQLESKPSHIHLLKRLYVVLQAQGKPIPLELEDRVLCHRLEAFPHNAELRQRLERVHFARRKLSRERTNEIILQDYRNAGSRPGNLYIQITNECNLHCVMCAHRTATKDNSFMDEELFRRCLDQATDHGIRNVVFAAAYGEALLHPKGIHYLRRAVDRGFQVTVATNGNFLQPTQIREVAALKLDLIQYSFFGYDKRSYERTYAGGNFERAAENLRLMKATLVEFESSTKFTVNGVNVTGDAERTEKTREFLRTLGVRDDEMRLQVPCNFGGHISPGFKSNKLNAKSFKPIDRLPFYICPLLLSTPGILTDGRMTACGCIDNNGALAIGDIRTQTIDEIRAGPKLQSIIEAFVNGDVSKLPFCSKCDIPYGNFHGEYNEPAA
jgi:pyruvate-formate lyase-activating enzyme